MTHEDGYAAECMDIRWCLGGGECSQGRVHCVECWAAASNMCVFEHQIVYAVKESVKGEIQLCVTQLVCGSL